MDKFLEIVRGLFIAALALATFFVLTSIFL